MDFLTFVLNLFIIFLIFVLSLLFLIIFAPTDIIAHMRQIGGEVLFPAFQYIGGAFQYIGGAFQYIGISVYAIATFMFTIRDFFSDIRTIFVISFFFGLYGLLFYPKEI